MCQIQITKDQIRVQSSYFNAAQTLECGQVFRFFKNENQNEFTVISGDKKCLIQTNNNLTVIKSLDIDYFYSYFDLGRDYAAVACALSRYPDLTQDVAHGQGIHILRQELFETIVSFIISANNNIKRIKGIIERLCTEFGTKKDGFYAFPTPDQLKKCSANKYLDLGAGYRSPYLYQTVNRLACDKTLIQLKQMDYSAAIKALMCLKGVGRKVADCIALFGLGHTCCYPVDTWIYKADRQEGDTKHDVRARGMQKYGDLSGFAQQYRFYGQRK